MTAPTGGIFISYRRADAAQFAGGRLYSDLVAHFGPDGVFRDIDTEPGVDIRQWVDDSLARCRAFIVLIDDGWLESRNSRGRRRLEDPADFLRVEIEAALARPDTLVVPVLFGDAEMPSQDELPESIRTLATQQASVELSDTYWDSDVAHLIQILELAVESASSTPLRRRTRPQSETRPVARQERPLDKGSGASEPGGAVAAEPSGSASLGEAPAAPEGGKTAPTAGFPDGQAAPAAQPAETVGAGGIELSAHARAILGNALVVLALRAASPEQMQPVDVLLAGLRSAQRGGSGSAEALQRALPEPRDDRLAEGLRALGVKPVEGWPMVEGDPAAGADVVGVAAGFLRRTTGGGPVCTRHLLAAAVVGDQDGVVLEALGVTQVELIAALRGYLRNRWPAEAPQAWDEILRAPHANKVGTEASQAPAPPPTLADDAHRLLGVAAGLIPEGDPGVDATTIVIAALAHEPLPVTKEMLAWLLRDDPNEHAGAELANRLLATRRDLSGHQGIFLDLDADVTAPLIAAAAEQAQRTTGRREVGARHLLGAALISLDVDAAVAAAAGTMDRLRAALSFAVQRTAPEDSQDAWDTILFGPNQQLGGGYSRDVGWPDPGEVDDTKDSLGRQDEAEMFASLITDEKLVPPLAIGLFGSWGSGKSFFMKLIYRAVAAKAPDRSFAQIRFNAWHYSDANLWASLADEIFEQLADHVREPEEDPEAARRRALELESEARKSIKARRDQVAARQLGLRAALAEATTKREQARSQSALAYASRLATEISKDLVARSDLDTVGKALGMAEPVDAYRALAGEASYLRDETSALTRGASGRLRWSLLAAAAALGVAVLLAVFLPGAVRAWGSGVAASVAAALALASRAVGSAGKVTAAARRFYERAAVVDERLRSAPTEEEARLTGQLREAEAAEDAAVTQLLEVDARIAALEAELIELGGERRLYRFLIERADSNDYRGQLGIISIIRKDLETLLQHLQRKQAELVLKRIVLYIDDLDRCEPKDVVAVLQAVNLLLGTSLFVVVLGVDPTWLERSLRSQYSGLVAGSTPREYLEKIIQLPYVLPAMTDGFPSLMGSLVGPLAVEPRAGAAPAAAASNGAAALDGPDPGGAGTTTEPLVPDALPVQESITMEAGSAAASGGSAGPMQAPTAPTRPELEMLVAMRPLVRTPRAATRLVNLYRLVRTTRDVGRSSRFLGTDGSPADYLVVIPLLAVATRSPEVLAELNARLLAQEDGPQTWAQLLAEPGPRRLQPDWDEIVSALNEISELFDVPPDLEPYRTWAPKLSRFTFTLTPTSGGSPKSAARLPTEATSSRTTRASTGPF